MNLNLFLLNSKEMEHKPKFKYYYGADKLLQKIEKFSKEIYLTKSDDNKYLLIKFKTPFIQKLMLK